LAIYNLKVTLSEIQLGYLEDLIATGRGTGDRHNLSGFLEVGFSTQPPKVPKNRTCLLAEDLHGSGFNLLGNLLGR
jgi:hypothetical protein